MPMAKHRTEPATGSSTPRNRAAKAPSSEKIYSKLGDDLRPRSLQKYKSILAAASRAFVTDGFERTSMDMIAEASGVSKRTVYGHFDSKHALFIAVIETLCAKIVPPSLDDPALEEAPVADVLNQIGRQFLRGIYSDQQIELLRTVITDAVRFPELGEVMFDGPILHSEHVLAAYLRRLAAAGRVQMARPELAAAQFMGMLKTNIHIRLLLKPHVKVSKAEIDRTVASCTDIFLHGVAGASRAQAGPGRRRTGAQPKG